MIVTVTFAYIVDILKSEPERIFRIKDVVDISAKSPAAVRRGLSALAGNGKDSGPIRRLSQGNYIYDASKEDHSFAGMMRSGKWKIENVRFDKKRNNGYTTPSPVTFQQQEPDEKSADCDMQGTAREGYPYILPTGQKVQWVPHGKGSETIWISANGARPLNLDAVLIVINDLEKDGMNPDEWVCGSTEYNIDDARFVIPGLHSVQTMKNVYYKAYQHDGDYARVEIVDRSEVHANDLINVLTTLAESAGRIRASRQINDLEVRIRRLEKQRKFRIPSGCEGKSYRKKEKKTPGPSFKDSPIPARDNHFRTAREIKNEREGITV